MKVHVIPAEHTYLSSPDTHNSPDVPIPSPVLADVIYT